MSSLPGSTLERSLTGGDLDCRVVAIGADLTSTLHPSSDNPLLETGCVEGKKRGVATNTPHAHQEPADGEVLPRHGRQKLQRDVVALLARRRPVVQARVQPQLRQLRDGLKRASLHATTCFPKRVVAASIPLPLASRRPRGQVWKHLSRRRRRNTAFFEEAPACVQAIRCRNCSGSRCC